MLTVCSFRVSPSIIVKQASRQIVVNRVKIVLISGLNNIIWARTHCGQSHASLWKVSPRSSPLGKRRARRRRLFSRVKHMRGLLLIAKWRGIREGLYVLKRLARLKVRPKSQSIQLKRFLQTWILVTEVLYTFSLEKNFMRCCDPVVTLPSNHTKPTRL